MTEKTFNEVRAEHMEQLIQFTPIVERVHGENHPEFLEVHKVFNQLNNKLAADEEEVDLNEEFQKLRELTNHYEVPHDVCESYEAVYTMLEDLDQAYFKQ
ncbi:MAG: iron-sulfur cluster repair di-iron protein, ric [Atopostipes sp.]|nr:iron-sulfur cluster repair di-iron protein, ric [Atopostipes sp.]